jgi:hypothetical protein
MAPGVELLFKHMNELWHDPQAVSPQQPMEGNRQAVVEAVSGERKSCGKHLMNLGAEPFVSVSQGKCHQRTPLLPVGDVFTGGNSQDQAHARQDRRRHDAHVFLRRAGRALPSGLCSNLAAIA